MVIKTTLHSVSSFAVLTNEKTTEHASSGTTHTPALNVQPPSPFATTNLANACSASAGARVLFATDEWFASADCLLQDGPPIFDPDAYCNEGKVMDGWESRRRREEGHDWCFIKLAQGAERFCIQAIEVDTAHFTGNNTPAISLELCDLSGPKQALEVVKKLPGAMERLVQGYGPQGVGHSPEEVQAAKNALKDVTFQTLLPATPLGPGYQESRMHYFEVERSEPASHLRLNFFPDGGVARLRLWGTVAPSASKNQKPLYMPISGKNSRCHVVPHSRNDVMPSQLHYADLELSKGGVGVSCTNQHYGTPQNLLQANFGRDMGDGWETARHPERPSILHTHPKTGFVDCDLSDSAILKLGKGGALSGVSRIILDTKHFRGNYPESVQVDGCFAVEGTKFDDETAGDWFPLIERVRMSPDSEHVFDRSAAEGVQIENSVRAVTHVKVTIFPDGGISRVRVYGPSSLDDAVDENVTSATAQ